MDTGTFAVQRIEPGDRLPGGLSALGSPGDFLLSNDRVAAVLDAVDHPHFVAPTGGSILDLVTLGDDNDSINNIFQATGLLPWDAVAYQQARIIEGEGFAAVQFRGHLDGRPDVPVATRYEIRPCEPGIRVRTEIVNGEPDPAVWTVTDGYFWGDKENLPFTPYPGAGYQHPSFGLTDLNDVFRETPYLVATSHTDPVATYATVACDREALAGFHSTFVSSAGTERRVVLPRDYEIFERFIAVANGRSVADGADVALEVRRQLFGERWTLVSGRLELPAGETFGNEVRASVHFAEGDRATPVSKRVPWTQVIPDADGRFQARLPIFRNYVIEVRAFGRAVWQGEVDIGAGPVELTAIELPAAGSVTVETRIDGAQVEGQVFFHPADDATRDAVAARLHGNFDQCAPLLGPPHGPSPACNRVLTRDQVTVAVPPGMYDLYATAGPFTTLVRHTVVVAAGQSESVTFDLVSLPLLPAGALSADLHVHGAISEDSVIPHRDRVHAFLAAGIDVIVATDHDLVFDYADALAALDVGDRLVVIPGVETTGHVLYRYVPGEDTPKVNGHWNFWPVPHDPEGPYRGAPWDELAEPGSIMTRMEDAGWPPTTGVVQMNHPWNGDDFGRDQAFPRAIGLDATRPLSENRVFGRRARGARFANSDYHVQEVVNGTAFANTLAHRALWFYLLGQGLVRAGTANSDSHGLTDNVLGTPRNIIWTATSRESFDLETFNADIRAGHLVGTNGPVIEVATTDSDGGARLPGLDPFVPDSGARLAISVRAAPWVPVDEIRIIVNGEVARTLAADELTEPLDPFGTADTVRWQGTVELTPLLPVSGDAWVVIEAGHALPAAADLDCDGIPDTGDNDGDGDIDWRDVDRNDDDVIDGYDWEEGVPKECEGDVGPLQLPAQPGDPGEPLYHFRAVVPGGLPLAFSNPLLLDLDGGGFRGPAP